MKNAKNIWKRSNKILKVGVLVLEQSNTLSLAAAVDPMRACNRRAAQALFSWEFLTDQGQNICLTSGLTLKGQDARNFSGDVLILVAGFDLEKFTTSILTSTLRRVASSGTCIIGVDGGSWVMAHAGLLDDHRATCHTTEETCNNIGYTLPSTFAVFLTRCVSQIINNHRCHQ